MPEIFVEFPQPFFLNFSGKSIKIMTKLELKQKYWNDLVHLLTHRYFQVIGVVWNIHRWPAGMYVSYHLSDQCYVLNSLVTTDELALRLDGYLSKNALLDGFNNTVAMSETKNDSVTTRKFFQTATRKQ